MPLYVNALRTNQQVANALQQSRNALKFCCATQSANEERCIAQLTIVFRLIEPEFTIAILLPNLSDLREVTGNCVGNLEKNK